MRETQAKLLLNHSFHYYARPIFTMPETAKATIHSISGSPFLEYTNTLASTQLPNARVCCHHRRSKFTWSWTRFLHSRSGFTGSRTRDFFETS